MEKLNYTCFEAHKKQDKSCQSKDCRFWHDLSCNQNCIINKVNLQEDLTLQEVGNLFGITRMRVCQIEKTAIEKLRNKNLLV
jgi:DNA-directed RNA polymerase sigma subunit (sigma70/sigma32)